MAEPPASRSRVRDPIARPLLWRLPLVLFVVVGIVGIASIDALLRRDVEREAERHAEQVQALIGSRLRDRASYVHALTLSLGALGEGPAHAPSFMPLARELHATAREVVSITLTDTLGGVHDRLLRDGAAHPMAPESTDASTLEQAVAIATAVRQHRLAITPTVTLRDGSSGIVMYDPILSRNRAVGLVGVGISHERLFTGAVAAMDRDRFSHRVRNSEGDVLSRGESWPVSPQRVVTRPVVLPDGRRWQVDIAVSQFEPFLPRLLTGLAGIALIGLVVAIVLREAARSERLAEHSLRLEMVSRDLLDANVRLEERAMQVAEANRAKSRFLANVSHELRTPINAIVGYNSLVLDGVYGSVGTGLREAHERIRLASRHLLALVDEVLDLSRIEAGRMALEAGPVDIAALLDSVAAVVEPTAAAKGVHIDVVLGRDLPRLSTDARHLRKVVLNLASNAVKFTEQGVVTLVARRDPEAPDTRMVIAIEDTGIGIAVVDHDRIFEEFEQVLTDARGDSLRRGTGLGLPIARKLARLLGGDIELQSTPGAGSRFVLGIPIQVAAREHEPSVARRAAAGVAPARVSAEEMERAVARSREIVEGPGLAEEHPERAGDASNLASEHVESRAHGASRDVVRDTVTRRGSDGATPSSGVDAPNTSD